MSGWIALAAGLLWIASIGALARRNDERWKDVGAGGMLALFVVAFFWRTISGDVYQPADGGDLVSFLFPTYRFAARTLSQGDLPLWNPHLYSGAPFISDIQAGFLYPPHLFLFLLEPNFPYEWMQWLSMAHLWWAGLGVYVLVRALGFSRPAALLAGTAFQFSDPLFIHMGNYNLIAVLAWIGWVLAAYHRALADRSLRWAGIAAVLFAVSTYAGHAQSTYYVGLAVGVYTVMRGGAEAWRRRGEEAKRRRPTTDDRRRTTDDGRPTRHAPRTMQYAIRNTLHEIAQSLLSFSVVAGLTFLLTAPILLPSLELIPYTARADFDYQETVAFSLAPVPGMVGLLTPGFFGRGPALHWSLWDRVELPYAGVPTLLLAVGALMLPMERKWRRLLPWIGLAIFGFVVALGIYTPVHGWLTQILPGFGQFRAPARAIVLFTLALSVLAAAGMDAVMRGGTEAWRRRSDDRRRTTDDRRPTTDALRITHYASFLKWGGLALLLLFLPAIYASLLILQPDSVYFLRASLAGLAISFAVAAWLGTWALVTLYRRGRLSAGWFATLLLALLLIELSATGAYTDIAETNPAHGFDHPEIVEFLRSQMDGGRRTKDEGARVPEHSSSVFRLSSPFRIDTRTGIDQHWQPDTAALFGLQDVGGIVNPLALRHWEQLWNALGGRDTRLYDMLNVRYVIVEDETPLPDQFQLAFDAPGPLAVYENPDPLPRAWLVTESVVVADEDAALAALQSPDFAPTQTVILTTEDEGRRTNGGRSALLQSTNQPINQSPVSQSPISQSPNLSISTYDINEITLTLSTPTPAYLVLSELWYPDWRAMVNGAETPVLRANYAFRAVPVPAGESTVRLRFAPSPWRWGLVLFGVGMLGLILIVSVSIRRR